MKNIFVKILAVLVIVFSAETTSFFTSSTFLNDQEVQDLITIKTELSKAEKRTGEEAQKIKASSEQTKKLMEIINQSEKNQQTKFKNEINETIENYNKRTQKFPLNHLVKVKRIDLY